MARRGGRAPGEAGSQDRQEVCEGYCSDISRTVVAGDPAAEQRKVYARAVEVHRATLDMIRPGLKACEIDEFARR